MISKRGKLEPRQAEFGDRHPFPNKNGKRKSTPAEETVHIRHRSKKRVKPRIQKFKKTKEKW